MLASARINGDAFGMQDSGFVVPDEVMEPELDFEADLRAQDAWRESQLLQETGGLGSMTRGLMRPGGRHTIVCKHWLRDLCMKGDKCDFLHQYDLARMPECLQWARFGKCPENDCDFRHDTERMECQKYKFGFCKLGSQCRMRHDKLGRNHLPEAMPDWYLKELVPNIFDFVPALPEEVVRVSKQPDFPSAPSWNVPMVPQDAWAAPADAWAVDAKPVVDLTAPPRRNNRPIAAPQPRRRDDRPERRDEGRPDRREREQPSERRDERPRQPERREERPPARQPERREERPRQPERREEPERASRVERRDEGRTERRDTSRAGRRDDDRSERRDGGRQERQPERGQPDRRDERKPEQQRDRRPSKRDDEAPPRREDRPTRRSRSRSNRGRR